MLAQQRFLRRRRRLAALLEGALDPGRASRQGPGSTPRIPTANRPAVAESLQHLVALLRDPGITLPKRTLRRVLEFATDPSSPVHGTYPEQAAVAARRLVDEVRLTTATGGFSPLPPRTA